MSRSRLPWFIDDNDVWAIAGRNPVPHRRCSEVLLRAGWTYDISEDGWWAPGLQRAVYSPVARMREPRQG